MQLPSPPREALRIRLSAQEVSSLSERVQALHDEICRFAPAVERVACALYDAELDLLNTFVDSTHRGTPLTAYQYRLSDSASLTHLARTRQDRVVDDIPAQLGSDAEHNRWLLAQGYRSSYTTPMFVSDELQGFMFYDSAQPGLFTPDVTAKIGVYGRLVALMIRHETTAVRSLVGSVRIAREFAHLRDVETGVHVDRMSRYCRVMARALAHSHALSDEFAEQLFLFSPLHDIGKIGVPDAILRKQGRFTPEERAEMKLHVDKGSAIVERLVADFALEGLSGVRVLCALVACHHEYLDGSGYPRGLRGDEIPIEARIVTVSDIFDALSSRRIYKERWSLDATFAKLRAMVDEGKVDAACVAALEGCRDEVVEIMQRFAEE